MYGYLEKFPFKSVLPNMYQVYVLCLRVFAMDESGR